MIDSIHSCCLYIIDIKSFFLCIDLGYHLLSIKLDILCESKLPKHDNLDLRLAHRNYS